MMKKYGEVRNVLSEKLLTSSSFDGGTRVQQFEKLLSKFTKSKFAVAVNFWNCRTSSISTRARYKIRR